jgi:hypothetical protein
MNFWEDTVKDHIPLSGTLIVYDYLHAGTRTARAEQANGVDTFDVWV